MINVGKIKKKKKIFNNFKNRKRFCQKWKISGNFGKF